MRRAKAYFLPLILMLLLSSAFVSGQEWSGVLAPARAANWTYAGIPGGIPSANWANCNTSACNTLYGGTVTTSSIAAACASAPSNTVVRIPAGTFTGITAYCNRGNVVLRGAGPHSTSITGTVFMGTGGTSGQGSYPTGLGSTNWTGGLTQGSTVLTVASTSGLSAGQTVVLDQLNASFVFVNAVEGACTSGNSCGRNDSPLQFFGSDDRAQLEMALIVSVNSSTQITIAAPGISHNYTSGLTPQVFYWNTPHNIQYAGVENMSVNENGNARGISLPFCDYCWTKNVVATGTGRGGVFFYYGYRDELRDSYIAGANDAGAPEQYGAEILESTFTKIENNIFFGSALAINMEGCYGSVIGYNYALNSSSGPQFADYDTHLAHNYLQLWEGNVAGTLAYDNSWGSSSQMTAFRNRMSGNSPNKTNYRVAMKVNAQAHNVNLVGNVIGDPTFHTQYVCDQSHQQGEDNFEYDLGFWNSCDHGTSNYDTVTESSLMRWANWDAVTWKANGNTNGVRYCTGSGSGNSACTASETGSTDPTFPGLASPNTTLPASFYNGVRTAHSSCGTGLSFWKNPSSGACPAYPPIGPDVTCTTNCIANTASHAAMIPAEICYNNTAKSNGFLTAFDASACYANDLVSSQPGGPAPPTALSGSVH
jgi:hypothetical protein